MEIWNSSKELSVTFCAAMAGSLPLLRGRCSGIVVVVADKTGLKIVEEIEELTISKIPL